MYTEISYETALARHPALIQIIMDDLARGKSKERGSAPETLRWRYIWALSVQSYTFHQILKGEVKEETRSLEERISCGLQGTKGRWTGTTWGDVSNGCIRPLPPEIMATMDANGRPLPASEVETALRALNPKVVVISGMSDTLLRSDITGFTRTDP
jgi:hypothetical protein